MISPLFTTIVLFAAFVWIYMKNTSKKVGSSSAELIEKELRANSVRKQPLDSLNYINFTENSIPFVHPAPNERVDSLIESLRNLTQCKIVNLTGISNTDLKLTYGPANLPVLTEFDQNFTSLARNLYDYGIELLASGYQNEAIAVLKYAISIGTDISGNYITLANIYVENQEYDKINELIFAAQSISSLTKKSTIDKLQEIMDTHTTMVVARPNDKSEDDLEAAKDLIPEDILDLLN